MDALTRGIKRVRVTRYTRRVVPRDVLAKLRDFIRRHVRQVFMRAFNRTQVLSDYGDSQNTAATYEFLDKMALA